MNLMYKIDHAAASHSADLLNSRCQLVAVIKCIIVL